MEEQQVTQEPAKKIPYPKSVFFILITEFCERFSYYGMRAILSIFFRNELGFTESTATNIYHTFVALCYVSPLIGAFISDGYWGKFNTIFYISILYACGNILLSFTTIRPLSIPAVPFAMTALLIIAAGTGGIKPCVSSFGGDQFVIPQQQKYLDNFFFIFYLSINIGAALSNFITPVLRTKVKCFERDTCYPLAFGLPGILMVIAILVFLSGRPFYKIIKPLKENVVCKWAGCILHALRKKFSSRESVAHWLDRSTDTYDPLFVEDVKGTLNVILIFVPLIMFWGLFEQQGSGWTFMAIRMNGDLGFYTMPPEQFSMLNPVFIVILVPIFTYVIYPLFDKCNFLTKPLQRIAVGGFLCAAAFYITAVVCLVIEKDLPEPLAKYQCQIRVYNPQKCQVTINAEPYIKDVKIGFMGYESLKVKTDKLKVGYNLSDCEVLTEKNGDFEVAPGANLFYVVSIEKGLTKYEDDVKKDEDGKPKVRTIIGGNSKIESIKYRSEEGDEDFSIDVSIKSLPLGKYKLETSKDKFTFAQGGVYTVLIHIEDKKITNVKTIVVVEPNQLHMMWLFPQYFVVTVAEIMVSVTGLEFAYTQSPYSMKSVMQSMWLMTTAFGQLAVVIINSIMSAISERTIYSTNYFVFATVMALVMVLFMWIASRYTYVVKASE